MESHDFELIDEIREYVRNNMGFWYRSSIISRLNFLENHPDYYVNVADLNYGLFAEKRTLVDYPIATLLVKLDILDSQGHRVKGLMHFLRALQKFSSHYNRILCC